MPVSLPLSLVRFLSQVASPSASASFSEASAFATLSEAGIEFEPTLFFSTECPLSPSFSSTLPVAEPLSPSFVDFSSLPASAEESLSGSVASASAAAADGGFATAAGATAAAATDPSAEADAYSMSLEDSAKYQEVFARYDSDGDG